MPALLNAAATNIPLSSITKVIFFKRDEITTDLICCEVEADGHTWFCHEEASEWLALVEHLQALPGFREDWFSAVSQPPFEESLTLAFSR
ncbi:hypothetical protein [Caulobacter sp.]|uniref:hypothetical protein n=1 Tax=Caulobacter sp. TaxID=78 RepID=UPI003BAAF158